MIQEQVKHNQPNLVLIFLHKTRITARLLCDLLITRAADGTSDHIKRMTCKLVHAHTQGIAVTLRQMIVDFGTLTAKLAIWTLEHLGLDTAADVESGEVIL